MSISQSSDHTPLSLARRVDALCVRFEEAWRAGTQPRIAEYLADVPEAERPPVLRELIALDAQYRRLAGEQPRPEEYAARFPALDPQLLAQALAEPGKSTATDSPKRQPHFLVETLPGLPQVPGYDLLGILGRGGMGVVYKARHLKLNRVVALKMILAGSHAEPGQRDRFRREAEAVARLQHPNIVQVYEVGEHDGLPYCALEYLDGGSLDKQLAGTPQPARAAAELVEILARAVHAAHQKGIVHRDLKPANVLRTAGGVPKVTDFGLAKRVDTTAQTESGAVMGTAKYMAPEQARGQSKGVGPTADVYALGVILYECLAGRPPFDADYYFLTLQQVIADEPVPPSRLSSNVPHDLEAVCLKCLEKEPDRRYTTAHDLAEDLHRFLEGEPVQARPAGRLDRALKWVRRHPARAVAYGSLLLAVALGLVGSGVTWLWWQAEESRHQAVTAGQQAEVARQQAEKAEEEVRQTNQALEKALQGEREARKGEAEAREQLAQTAYLRQVDLAYREWKENEVARAVAMLRDCPAERRRWEWDYVHRLCHGFILNLSGHTGMASSACFSPDGKRLASASQDATVKVWDAASGQVALTLRGHTDYVSSVCFSPDGQRLASASGNPAVKVRDATPR